MTELTRREFSRLAALAAGALIVLPQVLFGDEDKQFSAPDWPKSSNRVYLDGPAPISDGPAPGWQDFQYWFGRDQGLTHVGWTAKWVDGREYGDYISITDVMDGPADPIVKEACILLKEVADYTRHQLIVDAKLPCYCMLRCKIGKWNKRTQERRGQRIFTGSGDLLCVTTIQGKGKGWVRAAQEQGLDDLWRAIRAEQGPTNGY